MTGMGETETMDIETENMGMDYGLLAGANYMLTSKFGIRASYYLGQANVMEGDDVDDDSNIKNNTISFSALIKF